MTLLVEVHMPLKFKDGRVLSGASQFRQIKVTQHVGLLSGKLYFVSLLSRSV